MCQGLGSGQNFFPQLLMQHESTTECTAWNLQESWWTSWPKKCCHWVPDKKLLMVAQQLNQMPPEKIDWGGNMHWMEVEMKKNLRAESNWHGTEGTYYLPRCRQNSPYLYLKDSRFANDDSKLCHKTTSILKESAL